MASVAFDCLSWLFGFLRMGAIVFAAQALGADDTLEQRDSCGMRRWRRPAASWRSASTASTSARPGRDMRDLMLATYFAAWWLLESLDNAGQWMLIFFMARGAFQAVRYTALVRAPFA